MRRLTDLTNPAARQILLKALESDDPFVQQAAREGLQHSIKVADLMAIAGTKDLAPARKLGLLLILRDSNQPEARTLLPGYLNDPDPSIRFAAVQWIGEEGLTEYVPQLARHWFRVRRRGDFSKAFWRPWSGLTARRAVPETSLPAKTMSPRS